MFFQRERRLEVGRGVAKCCGLRCRIVNVNLAKHRDLALRQNLRAAILERYPVRPLEGEGTKKSDKIEQEGVWLKDSGLLDWHLFLTRQQSKNDEDRRAQVGLGTPFGVSTYKLGRCSEKSGSRAESRTYFNRLHCVNKPLFGFVDRSFQGNL